MATKEQKRLYQLLVAAVIFILAFGTVFYHFTEGWGWVDAYYFCVVTLATIGYGDFIPQTDFAKIFTTVYIFVGIAIFSTFLHTFLAGRGQKFLKEHPTAFKEEAQKAQHKKPEA